MFCFIIPNLLLIKTCFDALDKPECVGAWNDKEEAGPLVQNFENHFHSFKNRRNKVRYQTDGQHNMGTPYNPLS